MSQEKSKKIPWFMIPVYPEYSNSVSLNGISLNFLITTDTVPVDVTDTKKLNYHEQLIPGGYTSIHKYNSASARKISFKLEIASFNNDVGLGLKLSQFDLLRRPQVHVKTQQSQIQDVDGNFNLTKAATTVFTKDVRYKAFESNPYVIYYNSIFNSVPLPFNVLKCDFTTSKPNRLGKPQYAVVDFELAQMEDHWLSVAEDKVKLLQALLDAAGSSLPNFIRSLSQGNNPQNVYRSKNSKLGF